MRTEEKISKMINVLANLHARSKTAREFQDLLQKYVIAVDEVNESFRRVLIGLLVFLLIWNTGLTVWLLIIT